MQLQCDTIIKHDDLTIDFTSAHKGISSTVMLELKKSVKIIREFAVFFNPHNYNETHSPSHHHQHYQDQQYCRHSQGIIPEVKSSEDRGDQHLFLHRCKPLWGVLYTISNISKGFVLFFRWQIIKLLDSDVSSKKRCHKVPV